MHVTRIKPHTLWVMTNPAVEQCTKLLSRGDTYKISNAVRVNEFLIVFEKRSLVPNMTPEPHVVSWDWVLVLNVESMWRVLHNRCKHCQNPSHHGYGYSIHAAR